MGVFAHPLPPHSMNLDPTQTAVSTEHFSFAAVDASGSSDDSHATSNFEDGRMLSGEPHPHSDTHNVGSHDGDDGPTFLEEVPHTDELFAEVRYCEHSQLPIRLCYQIFGDLTGPPRPVILLVCGLNMQLSAWDEVFCESLVRAGFWVIRFDNRDIGHSTKVEQRGSVVGVRLLLPGKWASWLGERIPYTIEDMAKDALALLDALRISRVHLFGISMGGMIAQAAALLAPHRCLSLTCLMSTTNAQDLPDTQLWVKLWMLRKPQAGCSLDELLDFRVAALQRLLQNALPVDSTYLKRRYRLSLDRSSYGAGLVRQAAAVRRCAGRDEGLRHLHVPALVIHGSQDLVVPPLHGYRTASVLPLAKLLILKRMGHYFHPAFFRSVVMAVTEMSYVTEGAAQRRVGSGNSCPPAHYRHDWCPGSPSISRPLQCFPTPAPAAHSEEVHHDEDDLYAPIICTSPTSAVGAAACAAVRVAVPLTPHPTTPEAVLVDLQSLPETSPSSTPEKGTTILDVTKFLNLAGDVPVCIKPHPQRQQQQQQPVVPPIPNASDIAATRRLVVGDAIPTWAPKRDTSSSIHSICPPDDPSG